MQGRIYIGARGGARAPQIPLLPPPDSKAIAEHSDVIFEVPKCSKMQIFWGFTPDHAKGAYSAPQTL